MSIQNYDSTSSSGVHAQPAAKVYFTGETIIPDGSSTGDGSTNSSVLDGDEGESQPLIASTR